MDMHFYKEMENLSIGNHENGETNKNACRLCQIVQSISPALLHILTLNGNIVSAVGYRNASNSKESPEWGSDDKR